MQADAAGRPPRTVVGQLVGGLEARRRRGSPSLTVLCCDNLPHNGDTLGQLVSDFCELRRSSQAGRLPSWVSENVSFPNTMVDRIVPATTDDDRREAALLLGLDDRGVVVTEPFSQWVIEDRFAGPRPAWEKAGAMLAVDVAPYEEMKLRLLNGSHSALAYLGALAGFDLIADAVRRPDFARFTRAFMDLEVTPTLTVPPGFDLAAYKDALMGRFADPALRHRTVQIAMDGSQKLPYRLLGHDLFPSARWARTAPRLPGRGRLDAFRHRRENRRRRPPAPRGPPGRTSPRRGSRRVDARRDRVGPAER